MTYRSAGLAPGLEVLVAVADTGGITAAADRLGIPQPTASRMIARLSRELAVDLVVRDGRGIALTRQGRLLAEHGARALRELTDGLAAVRADSDAEHGHVVLGFLHSMGPVAVPALLRGFRREHPDVRVSLVQDAADHVLAEVRAGRVDLALASPVPLDPSLRRRVLARQPLVALVPVGHRLATRRGVRVSDLVDEPMVTMRAGYGVRALTDRLRRAAGATLTYAFETDELSTVAGLVSAGFGVSILPAGNAAADTVEIPLRDAGAVREISIAWSARVRPVPAVTALRRHLVEHGPALLRG